MGIWFFCGPFSGDILPVYFLQVVQDASWHLCSRAGSQQIDLSPHFRELSLHCFLIDVVAREVEAPKAALASVCVLSGPFVVVVTSGGSWSENIVSVIV